MKSGGFCDDDLDTVDSFDTDRLVGGDGAQLVTTSTSSPSMRAFPEGRSGVRVDPVLPTRCR